MMRKSTIVKLPVRWSHPPVLRVLPLRKGIKSDARSSAVDVTLDIDGHSHPRCYVQSMLLVKPRRLEGCLPLWATVIYLTCEMFI